MVKFTVSITITLILAAIVISCSNMGSDSISQQVPTNPKFEQANESGRYIWGMWDICIDTDSLTAVIMPLRELAPHFNVTAMLQPPQCYDCIAIKVNSFDTVTRIVDADATLRNPSYFSGYDVRGALYTNDVGHKLTNPDDWTPAYDIAGGMDINPFRAFAKSASLRIFLPGAKHTEKYLVQLPKPPQYAYIKYVVTACWPGNARDPYQIINFTQEEISNELTSSGVVGVDVYDWQNDVGSVWLYASEITGQEYVEMNHISGNTWQVNLVNSLGAAAGDYTVKIKAVSSNALNLPLYDFFTLTISQKPPPKGWGLTWGGTGPDDAWDVATDASGNAYVVGSFQGTADLDPHPSVDDHVSNGLMDAYLIKISNAGIYQWGLSWGSTNNDISKAVAVDSAGNIYVTGSFYGKVDFDPGTGVEERTSNGGMDTFLSKFNADGELLWVGTWGSISGDHTEFGLDVVTDNNNNVYVVGVAAYGNTDFDPGPGQTIPPPVSDDAFLSKFDSNCNFQWAGRWGAYLGNSANGVAVDNTGYIYVTGSYYVGSIDLDPGTGTDVHSCGGMEDAYLSKFNSDGDYQWGRTWGGGGFDGGFSVAIYGANNIYVRGYFGSTVDFDPGPGVDNHTCPVNTDDFVSKFNSTGDFQWADTWGGESNYGYIPRISATGLGDIITVGNIYGGPVDLDPGPGVDEYYTIGIDGYTSYFNPAGGYQWARVISPGGNQFNTSVITDSSNYIYVVGYFQDSIDLDPSPDIDEHTTNGNLDGFIVKYDPDGNW